MVSLFLVEDEIVMRDGIKCQIDWEKEGIDFVGEASDGELAFPMILETRPDILLTDIKMPFMDGLQLSELVKKELPDTYIIILSGYDEFSYAQKAVSLGVTEYLLKPLPPGKLLECIRRVQEKIEREKSSQEADWGDELLREQTSYRRQKLFRDLVMGKKPLPEILKGAQELSMNITARFYQMILMTVRREDGDRQDVSYVNELSEMVESTEGWYFFDRGEDGFAMLGTGNDEKEMEAATAALIGRLVERIRSYEGLSYYIGAGTVVNRISETGSSFYEANRAFANRFISGMNRVVYAKGLPDGSAKEEPDPTVPDVEGAITDTNSRDILESFMRTGTFEETEPFLEGLFNSIGEQNLESIIYLNYLVMDIFFSMARFLKEIGYPQEEIDAKCGDLNSFLRGTVTVRSAKTYLCAYLKEVILGRDNVAEKRYGKILREAVSYIDQNYNKEEISLNTVAQIANISPNHFSSIFSQEMGITFIEYLIQKRMDQAKILLRTTQMRSSEIAYQVGYRDPHYFSSTFKKTQGMTPREYRANRNGEEAR